MHPDTAAAFFALDEVGVIVGDGQVVGLERFFRDADAVHGVPAFVVTQQAVALPQFGGFDPLRVFYFAPVVVSRRGGECSATIGLCLAVFPSSMSRVDNKLLFIGLYYC